MNFCYWPPLRLLAPPPLTGGSTAGFLHASYMRGLWRWHSLPKKIAQPLVFLYWPLLTLGAVLVFTARNGPIVKRQTGKGLMRQMAEQVRLAAVHWLLPPWYYMFELYEDDRRKLAADYLLRFELKGAIYWAVKRRGRIKRRSHMRDKARFAQQCLERGIAAVPVIVAIRGGVCNWIGGARALPAEDLFVKPMLGQGGRGAERWDYRGDGRYSGGGKGEAPATLDAAQLLTRLQQRFRRNGCIVQPRVVNHPAVADLSNGALVTLRIMTCINERGEVEVTDAALRMARGRNTVVDNFHAGGIAARVDIVTGELGAASDLGTRGGTVWHDAHPDTGAPIRGRLLPMLDDVLDLVRQAHGAFADRMIVGWDVGLLADGPSLVEGNGEPDPDILQRTGRRPLGNARIGEILAHHMRVKWGLATDRLAASGAS
jgi:hypothetical protein